MARRVTQLPPHTPASKAQASGASDRSQLRKAEARLALARDGVALVAACARHRAVAEEAEARAAAAEAAAAAAAAAAQAQAGEASSLRRGLELAAEQLTRAAGAEGPSTLLLAVAKVRGP